jgi:hypothetical protein
LEKDEKKTGNVLSPLSLFPAHEPFNPEIVKKVN